MYRRTRARKAAAPAFSSSGRPLRWATRPATRLTAASHCPETLAARERRGGDLIEAAQAMLDVRGGHHEDRQRERGLHHEAVRGGRVVADKVPWAQGSLPSVLGNHAPPGEQHPDLEVALVVGIDETGCPADDLRLGLHLGHAEDAERRSPDARREPVAIRDVNRQADQGTTDGVTVDGQPVPDGHGFGQPHLGQPVDVGHCIPPRGSGQRTQLADHVGSIAIEPGQDITDRSVEKYSPPP
jgi:hypothetical protein